MLCQHFQLVQVICKIMSSILLDHIRQIHSVVVSTRGDFCYLGNDRKSGHNNERNVLNSYLFSGVIFRPPERQKVNNLWMCNKVMATSTIYG